MATQLPDTPYSSQPLEASRDWRWLTGLSPARERTREAALLAARHLDPHAQAGQIKPTELAITLVYTDGGPSTGGTVIAHRMTASSSVRWGHRLPSIRDTEPNRDPR